MFPFPMLPVWQVLHHCQPLISNCVMLLVVSSYDPPPSVGVGAATAFSHGVGFAPDHRAEDVLERGAGCRKAPDVTIPTIAPASGRVANRAAAPS